MKWSQARYEAALHLGAQSDFGYYSPASVRGPAVVVPERSGLGSITHHLMYHLMACTYGGRAPPWAVQGMAAFSEKIIGLRQHGTWNVS